MQRLREGTSLWEWFLAAVLIGLVLEVFLANRRTGATAGPTSPRGATPLVTASPDFTRVRHTRCGGRRSRLSREPATGCSETESARVRGYCELVRPLAHVCFAFAELDFLGLDSACGQDGHRSALLALDRPAPLTAPSPSPRLTVATARARTGGACR